MRHNEHGETTKILKIIKQDLSKVLSTSWREGVVVGRVAVTTDVESRIAKIYKPHSFQISADSLVWPVFQK